MWTLSGLPFLTAQGELVRGLQPLVVVAAPAPDRAVVLAAGRRTAAQVSARVSGDSELAGRILGQFNMMI